MANNKKAKQKSPPKIININYIKTNTYRTYHVDGVFGGITPNGKIHAQLFVQRLVTPQIIQHELIEEEGQLGREIKRIGKTGVVREIESGIIMDVEMAKIFRDWLDEKIKKSEEDRKTREKK